MRETLLSLLDDCLRRGTEPALAHWRGLRLVQWSYAQLAETAFQCAREFVVRGINKGDRVLLWAENSPEWIAAFFACLLRGAVAVPLDQQSAPDFAARVQQKTAAKLLLFGDVEWQAANLQLPSLALADLRAAVAHHSAAPDKAENISKTDLIEIIFTSGTTAEPKGVCLTHENFLANLAPLETEINKYLRWERPFHPLRFLSLLPLSHIFGQFMGIFVPQLLGGTVYFRTSLNPSEIINTVKQERVSVIVAFPRLLITLRDKVEREYAAKNQSAAFQQALAAAEKQHPLARWWTFRRVHRQFGWKFWAFISGGATLDRETEDFWRRLGFAVIQGYGMTETASIISIPHPFKLTTGSIGKALPGQEVKLNERGEILVRGANVASGYWDGAFKPLGDDEGWLHTGDLGAVDANGNIYFRGRAKDVIVTAAGLNIYPEDLEAALNQQPEIRDSTVIGVAGARGPEPLAVLIPRAEHADVAVAIERANERLAQHQQIRRWQVWPASDFPRTTTTRKIIKRLVAEAVQGQQPLAPTDTLAALAARIGGAQTAPADAQADLKLDSLGRVELLSALEDRYQVELDEAAFTAATTLGDIEKMLHEGAPQTTPYPFPRWAQRFPVTWLRLAVFYLLLLPLAHLLCWARVRGAEHLRAVRGPVLFVSNHLTIVDQSLILSALPARLRHKLAIAMLGEFLRDRRYPPANIAWPQRWLWRVEYVLLAALFNVFPLPQQSGFRRSFAFAGATLDRGYNVLLFPEGRRSPDGRLQPLMAGTGLLIAKLSVPVVPIRIDGLFELKQQGRRFARPGQVTINFGAPLRFAQTASPAEINKQLEQCFAAL